MTKISRVAFLLGLVSLCALPLPARAHAFPRHAVPGAGAVLSQAPAAVTLHFDAELDPQSCTLVVKDGRGVQVSAGKGQVDRDNRAVLYTQLPALPKGSYRVYWEVADRDGHRTKGDYTFTVR